MRRLIASSLLVACAYAAPAQAQVRLIARGSLGGSFDASGLTYRLENGLRGDTLGGIGSGLAYAGGNTFIATPDRGPNATAYNSAVDDTSSFVSRFQTLSLVLTPNAAGSALPFALTPSLTATTLLFSPQALTYGSGAGLGNRIDGTPLGSGAPGINTPLRNYFSGRSDNFGAGGSGNPADGRFDPEGVRVSNDGLTVFISDEYGPYVRQFDRATGQLLRTYTLPGNTPAGAPLPGNLNVANVQPTGAAEISGNTSGRVANKGMEGLAITPDGKTLVGIMQAPLIQDAANTATANLVRIVTIDIATGETHEYGYMLTTGSGVSEIVAINNTQFLIDERDGKGLGDGGKAKVKQIFKIDLAGATDITNLSGAAAAGAAVAKGAAFLDLVKALAANGVPAEQVPAKIEGLAFGQNVFLNGQLLHTLYVANDNDFVPGVAGQNQFYVFGFTDADLANLVAPVPEPGSWALMIAGFGLTGMAMRRRSSRVVFAAA